MNSLEKRIPEILAFFSSLLVFTFLDLLYFLLNFAPIGRFQENVS